MIQQVSRAYLQVVFPGRQRLAWLSRSPVLSVPSTTTTTMIRRSLMQLTKRRRTPTNKTKRPRLIPTNSISKETLGPYGLSKVDYQRHPPSRWPLPPPPPPPKNPIRRYFPVATFLVATAVGVYIYFHQDENVYEYWRQVELGNVPLDDDSYEADDDDDDDDEWEDANGGTNEKR